MLLKPNECKGCCLYGKGTGFVMPEGYNTRKVYIIGEAAGQHEENIGKPFIKFAQAGSKLEEIFRLTGYQRDNFKILNVVNCRPPNNKLEHTPFETPAIEHCRVHFEKEVKPDGNNIIFTLGNVPFKALTGYSGIKKQSITLMRGYIYESKYGYIIPSLHPSFIKRGKPSYTPYLMYDLAKAVKLSELTRERQDQNSKDARIETELLTDKSGEKQAKSHYNEFPSQDDLVSFYYKVKDNANLILAYDIETPYSPELDEDERDNLDDKEITQIQFSITKGEAIAFPFTADYLPFVKLLFLTSNDKIGHNSYNFDNPRLKANGIKLKGKLHDSMWMFKQWQPALLRNLQSVASLFNYPMPWKHLFSTELRWYGCADVDSIQYIYPKLKELMVKEGIYEGYLNHIVDFFPILQDAANRGIPVNEERRLELRGYLEKERIKIDDEIQKLVPNHIKKLGPVKKDKETKEIISTGYKSTPKAIKEEWIRYSSIKRQWEDRNLKSEPYPYNFSQYLTKRVQETKDNKGKLKDRFIYILKVEEIIESDQTSYQGIWHKQYFFKPSKEQLVKYIEWKHATLLNSEDIYERRLARKYVVPTKITKKGEPEKVTTGGKALEELLESTYDEVIRLIIGDSKYESDSLMNRVGIRSIDTNINNYIKNWKAKADGCVHTQFGFTAASGQLDSRSPNILNASKHTVTGQLFRRIIEAPKDHVFVECVVPGTRLLTWNLDWKAIEELKIGEELVGFDEYLPTILGSLRPSRRIKKSIVTNTTKIYKHCLKITTDLGVIECSKDHSFVRKGYKTKLGGYGWIQAKDLKVGHKLSYFTKPWINAGKSLSANYLAGFLDGEGYITSLSAFFGQNEGLIVDYVRKQLSELGLIAELVSFKSKCGQYKITNEFDAFAGVRAIGQIKPIRLLPKLQYNLDGSQLWGKRSRLATILKIEEIGVTEVVALETSTHTYISEGFLSHNCDFKSFHVATMGYIANDPDYIRFSQLDPHSYFTAYYVNDSNLPLPKLTMSNEEILQICGQYKKKYKEQRQFVSKPVVLGNQLGLGAKKIWLQNKKYFTGYYDAQEKQNILNDLFPKIVKFKKEVKELAHSKQKLVNDFGYLQRFFEVYQWQYDNETKSATRIQGSEAEKAIAFLVQSSAFGKIRYDLLKMRELGYLDKYNFVNSIHDSVIFLPHKSQLEECLYKVREILTSPCPILLNESTRATNGLVVGVEATVGRNWQNYDEIKNPEGLKEYKFT